MEVYLCTIILTLEIPILVSIILLFNEKTIYTKIIVETTRIDILLITNFIYILLCIIGSWLFTIKFDWFNQNIYNLIIVIYTIVLLYIIIFKIYIKIFKIFASNIVSNFTELTLLYSDRIKKRNIKKRKKTLNGIIDIQFTIFKIILHDNKIDNNEKIKMLNDTYKLNIEISSELNVREVNKFLKFYQEYTYDYIHNGVAWYSEVNIRNREFIIKTIRSNIHYLEYWDENIDRIEEICKLYHYSEEELRYLFELRYEIYRKKISNGGKKSNLLEKIEKYLNYNLVTDRRNHSKKSILLVLENIKLNNEYGNDFENYISEMMNKL